RIAGFRNLGLEHGFEFRQLDWVGAVLRNPNQYLVALGRQDITASTASAVEPELGLVEDESYLCFALALAGVLTPQRLQDIEVLLNVRERLSSQIADLKLDTVDPALAHQPWKLDYRSLEFLQNLIAHRFNFLSGLFAGAEVPLKIVVLDIGGVVEHQRQLACRFLPEVLVLGHQPPLQVFQLDRKSTRLNS